MLKPIGLYGLVVSLLLMSSAHAQQTLKIGVILPYSGPVADAAAQIDGGIKLYMAQHGDTVAGRKIEIIRKDTGGAAPALAKRLAQELVVRDKVDLLAGFFLTPNVLAAADVSAEAKKVMVIMNAGTSISITKSPYSVRTSFTLPQTAETLAKWAAKQGIKNAYTMVSDYAPGHESEQFFQSAFKEAGGQIIGSVHFPVPTPDFSAYVQRAKDINPASIFLFMPAGTEPAAFGKALAERGISPKTTKILGMGDLTSEQALKAMGNFGIGIITAWNYDYNQDSKLNREFVKAYNELLKRNPDFTSVGGYDGMHLIYEALRKTGGKADGDTLIAAMKGMKWESPRGPIMIDPETRDIVQTIYIRRVEKVGGELRNVVIDKVENVKNPGLAPIQK